jgi:hypothetical protein
MEETFKHILDFYYGYEIFIEFDTVDKERYVMTEYNSYEDITNDELEPLMELFNQELINPKSFMTAKQKELFEIMYEEFQLNK